ncbi:MAG: C4-dicarboxylate ABC transporter [Maritimibacter sp.]|nr:C4-dicarboxylate ABC transporter [Maritimibacter sp.]
MTRRYRRRGLTVAGFLAAVAIIAAGAWWVAFTSALDQLRERGEADLALAADRLTGQLQRVRDLAVVIADHPVLKPLVLGQGGDVAVADAQLQRFADRSVGQKLWLADASGWVLAASDRAAARFVGGTRAFERALDGALGTATGVDPDDGQRFYMFAAPVFSEAGPVAGAVLVRLNIAQVEWNWPSDPSPVFFTDAMGVVMVTNRPDLVLTVRSPGPAGALPDEVYAGAMLRPFPDRREWTVRSHDLWALEDRPDIPRRALHLSRELPTIGVAAEILVSLQPALRLAWLQAAVAAALCLAFGAMLFYIAERRRALSQRLEVEERANAELEARVAERTEALSLLNEDLRHEIEERHEAEAALRQAQAELVRAGKLSALGQMSAGLSHELNQPLMAIQSFAENGAILLERGKADKAGETLGRISDMAQRMARIIRNLRAFARQETAPASRVGLAAVVESTLELLGPRIADTGTRIDWKRPDFAAVVMGGEVRLSQVVLNLLSNAMDAMADVEAPVIRIRIEQDAETVRLVVHDSGPGISEPERIFDPFYTTKEVGGEGMGLGLSISYGLVQSFGGRLTGENAPGGGAVFTVELERAEELQ